VADGLFLFLEIRRRDCPDGAYVVRLLPQTGSVIDYPFQVRGAAADR